MPSRTLATLTCGAEHAEVLAALQAIGNPVRGEAVRLDRGSQLQHLGIGFPALRKRVKQGFSFSTVTVERQLPIWSALWRQSPCGDVLFAAIEAVKPVLRKPGPMVLWPHVRDWIDRVDNWCHADGLATLMSPIVEADLRAPVPGLQQQLLAWNGSGDEWQRRLSLTSLIHYSGRNAIFLPAQRMLPLLEACVADHRKGVDMALGWVLREMDARYRPEVDNFLHTHGCNMSARAFARAIEKRPSAERAFLLAGRR